MDRRLPRQNFPLNLPTNRRLCSTVGGRIVEGWAAHCSTVSAARSRAATMTNLARSSLALVLHALFGAAKSCALVNLFMICPRWLASGQPTTNQILLLITAISWHLCEHVLFPILCRVTGSCPTSSALEEMPRPILCPAQSFQQRPQLVFAAVPLDQIVQAGPPVVLPPQHFISECGLLEPLDRELIVAGCVGVHDARCLTHRKTDHPVGMARVRSCRKAHQRFVVGAMAEPIAD